MANVSHTQQCPAQPSPCTPVLNGRCLVLEDNVLIAMDLEAQLFELGAGAVDLATTAAHALALIAAHRHEFALLDVNLGGGTSIAVAERLHRLGVPMAFLTGDAGFHLDTPGLDRMPVLLKPLDTTMMRNAVTIARSTTGKTAPLNAVSGSDP